MVIILNSTYELTFVLLGHKKECHLWKVFAVLECSTITVDGCSGSLLCHSDTTSLCIMKPCFYEVVQSFFIFQGFFPTFIWLKHHDFVWWNKNLVWNLMHTFSQKWCLWDTKLTRNWQKCFIWWREVILLDKVLRLHITDLIFATGLHSCCMLSVQPKVLSLSSSLHTIILLLQQVVQNFVFALYVTQLQPLCAWTPCGTQFPARILNPLHCLFTIFRNSHIHWIFCVFCSVSHTEHTFLQIP